MCLFVVAVHIPFTALGSDSHKSCKWAKGSKVPFAVIKKKNATLHQLHKLLHTHTHTHTV